MFTHTQSIVSVPDESSKTVSDEYEKDTFSTNLFEWPNGMSLIRIIKRQRAYLTTKIWSIKKRKKKQPKTAQKCDVEGREKIKKKQTGHSEFLAKADVCVR